MSTANQITISTPDLDKTITITVPKKTNQIEVSADGSISESFSDAEGESF